MDSSSLVRFVGFGLSLLMLFFSFKSYKRKRLIDDMPTSKAHGTFIGLVELSGKVECANPLTSFLTESLCVYYSWSISEHWSRTTTETYTDSQGRTKTRTKTESGWKTVASGESMCPFDLRDETGAIQIRPEKAKIEGERVMSLQCRPSDPLYYGKGPASSVANSDHRRMFTETIIPLGLEVYVVGQAREREDIVAPEVAYDKDSPLFLISTREEKKIGSSYALNYWLLSLGGLAIILISIFISTRMGFYRWLPHTTEIYLTPTAIYLGIWLVSWFWIVYNSLKTLRERVRQGFSQVEVQLKRRHDLIPRLSASVSGLMRHEQDLQTVLAALRAKVKESEGEAAESLLSLVENYPELKSSSAVTKLQKELTDTENRLELARAYYNDIVTFYNTRLERVPDIIVAKLARLKTRELLSHEENQS